MSGRNMWLLNLTAAATALGYTAMAQPYMFRLESYDVVWDSPSKDSAGSMPIGNGEVVLNTWVEESTGDILILIARTDALSEISRVMKVGRVRVKLYPSPFLGRGFKQHLHLREGAIEFSGSGDHLRLFVDSGAHVIHLTGTMSVPRTVSVELELWRTAERPLPKTDMRSAWAVHDAPFPLVESADRVFEPGNMALNHITWFHQNTTSVVPKLWENQSLTGLPGTWDPILNRTFGGQVEGSGLIRTGPTELKTRMAARRIDLTIGTHTNQNPDTWMSELEGVMRTSKTEGAQKRTRAWWQEFWNRSWVFVDEGPTRTDIPDNDFPLRKGLDSNGQNQFPGEIRSWTAYDRILAPVAFGQGGVGVREGSEFHPKSGLSLVAEVRLDREAPGRIFDKVTAGGSDGFLFDTHPGKSLRLIVGNFQLSAPDVLQVGAWHKVAATFDPATGEAALYRDGERVAHHAPQKGSAITRGYILQRFVQACQGRGEYPIKFNGGYYTVEPAPMGIQSNPDFRNWGDCHWFQNVRHTVHPMLASGDFEMMESFFRLYEASRKLAESRTKLYHGVEGAYFPETMTVFGTYSGGDYGWNRTGLKPKDVQSPWWDDAWNQGPELVALMLDRWDFTRDNDFLRRRVLPMAESVLRYFDTRFRKDDRGKIVLDPTQVVETYWDGVVNDMPTVSGLISILDRLNALPSALTTPAQRATFQRLRKACPELPTEIQKGKRELAPAEKYVPKTSNVENGELYAVWPFRDVCLSRPALIEEARTAYANRRNHLDTGWGYDGNVAALLGMTEEAARILRVKASNSHPAYRWPATWGPNFDWLPDQNHGGNLLSTTQLMLMQAEPIEHGGEIRVFPAWPRKWDASFKLHAPGMTLVEAELRKGKVIKLKVTPTSRRKDVVLPPDWK